MSSLLFNSGDMLLLIEKNQWETICFHTLKFMVE